MLTVCVMNDSLRLSLWLVCQRWRRSLRWRQMSHLLRTHRQIRLRAYVTINLTL